MLNCLKKLIAFIVCCCVLQVAFGQAKTVSGKITDEKGNGVPGATVTAKGSQSGTSTDANGNFNFQAPSSANTLLISSVGYSSLQAAIGSGTSLTISLQSQGSSLNDVVVVGYGTARRRDITGAVSSISAKDFNQGIITTPMDAVQGKVPGLVITKPDGDPNSNPIIRLRGQTSLLGTQTPLLVVDGVILDNYEVLSSIPTADIVSFDFLKDASAASIYGSRGANGVVIIATKKGKSGSVMLDYNGSVSVAKDAKYYDIFNAHDFLVQAAKLGLDSAALNQGGNSDWQRAITRTAYTQNHNIGLSGGNGGFTYRASVDYQDQQGIVINTGRKQVGVRLNAEQKALHDKLDIQLNVLNTETKHKNIDANIFYWAYNISPTIPEKVNGVDNPIYNYNYVNPVWVENNELRQSTDNLKQQNIVINYDLLKGLKVGVQGNLTRYNIQYDYYLPQIPGSAGGLLTQGIKYNTNINSDKGDAHLNYAGTFGKSSVTGTAVYEYNYYTNDYFYARGNGFLIDDNQNNSLQSGISTYNAISSGKEEFKLISFLGRVTYNYDSKYYLTASLRRDGSSKFGVNNRWGYFPAVSAAWRISQEKFLKNVAWIDEIKINAGYGVTGNSDPIGAYNTILLLSGSVHTYDPTSPLNPYPVGYSASQNPNPDLRWEKRVGKNIGTEFSFLKSRITGSLSIFSDKTKDMLYNYGVQVPPNFISSVLTNVGSMTNKGVELGLNVEVIRGETVGLTIGGQITTVHTRVTSLSGTWQGNAVASDHIQLTSAGGQGLSFNPLTYLQVGYYPSVFYLPHYVGKDQTGTQLLDSAGVKGVTIDGNPTYYYTDPSPKFTYGFNFNLRLMRFNLSAAFNGNYGQKVYNNTRLNMSNYGRFPGLNSLKETFTNGLTDKPTTSDYWLEKASYLRLQSLTLAYSFPKLAGVENLRVYLAANNLFVITKYSGLDPEISPYNGSGGTRAAIGGLANSLSATYGGLGGAGSGQGYLDNNYAGNGFYPRSRSLTLGLSISVK
jgi:TonB-linked SusC/RagA family outer membrane protein